MQVLDALDEAGLTEKSIIIRTADHGELGLSHGMREKAYSIYEEMIHIPLIISNPRLFPTPQKTEAFYSHLDLLPTLTDLTGIANPQSYGKGTSIAPVIADPSTQVQDAILFAYDDVFILPQNVPGGHIRAIREGDWAYAVYYSQDGSFFEYEMYDLNEDPRQLRNLLYGSVAPDNAGEALRLHKKLVEKIHKAHALPVNFELPPPLNRQET